MKNYMDGGEAILEAFRKLKIDYILSSPGSEWSPVWEALVRQKTGNRQGPGFIDCWHETLAVNMATGYTLMTGRPQAVLVHAGVGLLQGSMGVHGALQSEIPMIVMSGESTTLGEDPDLPIEQQWYGGLSVGGIERFVENITKSARPVTSPFTLYEQVIRAGEMSQRTPRGPIYLNVALEHMLHDWTPPPNDRDVPFAPRVEAHPSEIAKVADLLLKAKNPVVVAEQSGRDPEAFKALVELADLLAIPVMWGRVANFANFPTDHPLYLGVATYEHLKDADLVLLVGGRAPWYPPHTKPTKGKIVAINENQFKGHMIYQNLHADAYLEGDIAAALQALSASRARGQGRRRRGEASGASIGRPSTTNSSPASRPKRAKANGGGKGDRSAVSDRDACRRHADRHHLRRRDDPARPDAAPAPALHHPAELLPRLWRARPGPRHRARRQACGAEAAGRLLIGDGGFLYNPVIQALGASKEHNLPILIVIFNNKGYMAMQKGHVHHYPDGAAENAHMHLGSRLNGFDYDGLGRAFRPARRKGRLSRTSSRRDPERP